MSTDHDTTRIVRSWLRSDRDASADHLLDAVLDRVDTTPQRRVAWWQARTLPGMSRFATFELAAVAVVLVAVIGIGLFATGGGPNLGGSTSSPDATEGPSEAVTRSPRPEVADLWVRGADPQVTATVAVPDGWTNTGHAVSTGSGATHAGISFWTIAATYADPCNWDGSELVTVPAGGSAADAVSVLVTAWATSSGGAAATAPSVTEPVEAMLDGYAGQYVELTPPSLTDFTTCDGGGYRLWVARDDAARFLQAPGRVLRLWFLDVGTQVLVVDVTYTPVAEQSPDRWPTVLEQLEDLIASVEIRSSGQ